MKILLISQWYAPEPDGRVSALAEGLVKKGHEVNVVTAFPHYPKDRLYDGYRLKWRQWEKMNGVTVLRLQIYPDYSRSVVKRSINYLSFMASLMFLAPFLLRRTDVIWSYTVLVGLPSIWISRLFRVPIVMEIADIWPDTITASGMLKKGLMVKILDLYSRWVYKEIDAFTVQNPGFKTSLTGKGVEPKKIHLVENWADPEIYRQVERNDELAREFNLNGKFNVVFAGNMGAAQGLDTVVEAAANLADIPSLQFVFIGNGSCMDQTKKLGEKLGAKNLLFLGRQPQEKMSSFFAIADALLVHLRDSPVFSITIPAKTQVYLACGRPIIMAVKGDGARLIEENGCGVTVPPEDPRALAANIKKLMNMTPLQRKALGDSGRRLYSSRFTKLMLLDKMESVLMEITGKGKGS